MLIYFLPTILALGIITSYEDAKEGKIRNKYLVAAVVVGLITHLLLMFFRIEQIPELTNQLIETFLAFATGFFIWYIDWWSAGDAKLFSVYFFLFPVVLFQEPSTAIHIITFLATMVLPLWLLLFIRSTITRPTKIIKIFKSVLNTKELLKTILLVFSIPWIIKILMGLLGLETNFLISIAGLIIISKIAEQYLANKAAAIYALILLCRVFLTADAFLSIQILITTLPLLVAYIILRHFAIALMIEKTYSKPKNIKKRGKHLLWHIYTQKDVPFAPIMLLGVLITSGLVLTRIL